MCLRVIYVEPNIYKIFSYIVAVSVLDDVDREYDNAFVRIVKSFALCVECCSSLFVLLSLSFWTFVVTPAINTE